MSKEQTPKKWIDFQQEQMEKKIIEDVERLKYTAQEGSTLDKIWKGEYMSKEQTPITAKDMYATKECRMMEIFEFAEHYAQAKVLEALEMKADIIRERLKNCEKLKEVNEFDKTFNTALKMGFKQALEDITKQK